jgi:hypothetical protein
MIDHNDEAVTVAVVTYVHGHGLSIRSVLNPVAAAEHYMGWLEHMNFLCEHSLPVMWVFTGVWPKRNTIYSLVTADLHAAEYLVKNPVQIRHLAQRADLIALDPEGSGQDSVGEHDLWRSRMLDGNLAAPTGFDQLQTVSADSVEDFLRDVAEGKKGETDG